jgi:SAM-dependent methyltransferase
LVVTSAVEGFGIVVLEANALGVPVVASSGVPEGAVRDGVNGLRYKFGDIAALGDEVVRLLKDDALHSKLSRSARENVERFRWSRVGAEFEHVVSGAIDQTSPHPPALSRIVRDGLTRFGMATPALATYRLVTSANPRTAIANARLRRLGAPDGLPIPPANLVFLVAGSPSLSWFLRGGALAASSITEAMSAQHVAIGALGSILDFGCGCGRVLRNWHGLQGTKLYGTDNNPALVEWSRRNLTFADVRSNSLEPPLAFADAEFDLIYALSVFTHLTQELQTAWIDELSRVLKPGGHLVVSAHGERYLRRLTHSEQRKFQAGELVVKGDTKAPGSNACSAYHPVEYVRRLAGNLEVAAFLPQGALGNPQQDLYVLRKPVGETRR